MLSRRSDTAERQQLPGFQAVKIDDLLQKMGNRIISRRKQLQMTQEELAEAAGVTSQMISAAELGKKALRPIKGGIDAKTGGEQPV